MKTTKKAAKLAATGALAMFIATGAFAADRGQWQSQDRKDQRQPPQQQRQSNQWQADQRQSDYGRQDRDRGYNRGEAVRDQQARLRGVVVRVDDRDGDVTIRDRATGRLVKVETSGMGRERLRRGDFVTVEGQWTRGNVFTAYHIDNVR